MRLRQICDTPALFMEDYHGESGKLESLLELLEQIQTGSHRVLKRLLQYGRCFQIDIPYLE